VDDLHQQQSWAARGGEHGKGRDSARKPAGEKVVNLAARSTTLQVPGEAMTPRCPWGQKENGWPRDEGFAPHAGSLHTPAQTLQEAATAPGLSGAESSPPCRHSHMAVHRGLRLSALPRQEPHLMDLDEYRELWLVPRIMKGGLGEQLMREVHR